MDITGPERDFVYSWGTLSCFQEFFLAGTLGSGEKGAWGSCLKRLNVFTKQLRKETGGRVSAYSQELQELLSTGAPTEGVHWRFLQCMICSARHIALGCRLG